MKTIRFLCAIGFVFFSFTSLAQQEYAFRVLANKGLNQVKANGIWAPLKTGIQLYSGDEIKVSDNASVGLVSEHGTPLEIKESSIYKIDDLLAKVGTNRTVLNKYADFIFSTNSADTRKNRLSATGAVRRGFEEIKINLPKNGDCEVYNPVVVINWQSATSNAPYLVFVRNLFDEEIIQIETSLNGIRIDLSDSKFIDENFAVIVEVRSKMKVNSKSGLYLIKKLSCDRLEAIKTELAKTGIDSTEQSAFNQYLLAGFFEENKLLVDSITCYERALKMDPDNPTYKDAYEDFMLRNALE